MPPLLLEAPRLLELPLDGRRKANALVVEAFGAPVDGEKVDAALLTYGTLRARGVLDPRRAARDGTPRRASRGSGPTRAARGRGSSRGSNSDARRERPRFVEGQRSDAPERVSGKRPQILGSRPSPPC